MDTNLLHKELSYRVVGLAMEVHSKLGYGFLEKVYENALMVLLRKENIAAAQQVSLKVMFENEIVGEYCADIVVDKKIILELKSTEKIIETHVAQTLNYLKATGLKLALIVNFGPRGLEHKRLVL